MADNILLDNGDTIRADDIAGIKTTASKFMLGADGSDDGFVSAANPCPVTAVNAGTFAVQVDGDALTALQLLDDAVYTDATGTPSKGFAVMGTDGTNPQLVSVDTSGHLQVDVLSNALPTGAATETTLDAIKTAVELLDNIVSGTEAQVDVVTSALPTGAATAANQSTANTALSAIQTAVEILDNAISGSEMQVDIVSGSVGVTGSVTVDAANDASLNVTIGDGTNTATIRNLAANDALNVSIVDGAGNQVTSFGGSGGTSATDDAAFTAGSGSGTPAMGFYSSDTVNSGDVGVLAMDASRRLLVSIEADNAGIGGGTQYAVDAALGATPTGTLAVGIRDDALSTLTPIEGDAVGLRVDANGALWVAHSGAITANLSATDNAVLDQIEVNTSYGDQTGGGLEASALRVTIASDSTGVLSVDDNGGSLTVDNSDLTTIAGAVSGSEMQVDVVTSALPTGAATETTLDAIKTAVEILDNVVSGSEAQVDVVTQPARDNTTDTVTATDDTAALSNDGTLVTPKWAAISAATSGDNTLVAAVASKKIRVVSLMVVASAAVTVRFESGAGGTALTGAMDLAANAGFVLPYNKLGWFETAAINTLLNLELSGAIQVSGVLQYVEV